MGRSKKTIFKVFQDPGQRTALWAAAMILLLLVGWLAFEYRHRLEKSIAYLSSIARDPIGPISQEFSTLQFGTLSQPITVLFMGTDVVYQGDRHHHFVVPGACSGNSDTIFLVFLNPYQNTISVLNIPRDTEAIVGKYGVRKINSANPLGGPELAKSAVTELLNVPVDHYVVMNVQALVQLVNELGGITVKVPEKMSYMDWTAKLKIDLTPGPHTLTGNQAMGFVRFRHDALGDIGRVQRQQLFLQAVSQKMIDPRSWVHIPALMGIAQSNIQTDLSQVDMFKILNFAHAVPKSNIKFVMLPGHFAGNGDWIATTDGRELAAQMANPYEELPSSRKDINVCVVNATSDRTAGHKIAVALRALGYIVSVAADAEDYSRVSRIIAQNGDLADAKMLQKDLGNIGEVVNASVGVLNSSITLVAHDDLQIGKIQLSSVDVPQTRHHGSLEPIVVRPPETAGVAAKSENLDIPQADDQPPAESPPAADDMTGNDTSTNTSDQEEPVKLPTDEAPSPGDSNTILPDDTSPASPPPPGNNSLLQDRNEQVH